MKKRGFNKNVRFIVVLFLCLLILSVPPVLSLDLNLTYDENGNLITGDGKFREYNEFNQLVRVRNGTDSSGDVIEEYLYHPSEDRVLAKKVYNISESTYPQEVHIYVNGNFVRNITNIKGTAIFNDTYYVKDENGLIGETNPDYETKLFYHNDHLGSTSLITNETGDLVEETSYEPFGAILETYYDPLGGEFKGGEVSRYYYEGKEFSERTGEYDFHFRKYNPELMIFTQPDAGLNSIYDPQQINRYSFERGNPYKYVDPDGHYIETALDIASIAYDITQLRTEEGRGDWVNWVSLGVDVTFTAIPIATGGGVLVHGGTKAIRGVSKAEKAGDITRLSKEAEQVLKEYGGKVMPYGEAKLKTQGLKGELQAHKLVEARQLKSLGEGSKISQSPSTILTKSQHQTITSLLRTEMPYATKGTMNIYEDSRIMRSYDSVYTEVYKTSKPSFYKKITSSIKGWFKRR